jgi:hypothetical protein
MEPTARRCGRWKAALAAVAVAGSVAVPVALAPPASAVVQPEWVFEDPDHSPPGLYSTAMATEPDGDIVLFGGRDDSGAYRDETWSFDGADWSQVASSGPSASYGSQIATSPANAGVVLFGGYVATGGGTADGLFDETWVLSNGTWSQRTPANAPPKRRFHTMVSDAQRGEVLLFGGRGASGNLDDTWVWNGLTWQEQVPDHSPPPRTSGAMAYDPIRGEAVLFGGTIDGVDVGDTWVWDGSDWEERTPANTSDSPSARRQAAMAFDPNLGGVVLYGGFDGSDVVGDTWVWDGEGWSELDLDGPLPRSAARMALHPATARLVLYGGSDGTAALDETWTFGARVDPGGVVPPPVRYASDLCNAGTNLVAGFVGDAYVKARTAQSPIDPDVTLVCFAADDRVTSHVGGLLEVGSSALPAATDSEATTCEADPNNEVVVAGTVHGGQPVRVDVTADPSGEDDLWVCLQLTSVAVRLRFASANGPTEFEPDLTAPHPTYAEEAWPAPAQPSAACAAALGGATRLVNARVGETFVGLYGWEESATRAHLCYRAADGTDATGARVTLDGLGNPGVSTSLTDVSPCTFPEFSIDTPPVGGLWLSGDLTTEEGQEPPVSACVKTASGSGARVTVGESGVVSVEQDSA